MQVNTLPKRRSLRQLRILIFLLAILSASCDGETLKDFLAANHVPFDSFSSMELAATVQGFAKENGNDLLLAYTPLKGEMLAGPSVAIRYDRLTGKVLRTELSLSENDICGGLAGDIYPLSNYTLLPNSTSPSAGCLLVLNSGLHLERVLYGFSPVEVAPGFVVLVENMIHFAPVHPERLQLAELSSGKTWELYPPKGDVLRARLAAENMKHMPSQETCERMNDPCDPHEFDEEIQALVTDGRGRFAFVAQQSANHIIKEGDPSETFASQMVTYVYQRVGSGWRYCERELMPSEIEELSRTKLGFKIDLNACLPGLDVASDHNPAPNR